MTSRKMWRNYPDYDDVEDIEAYEAAEELYIDMYLERVREERYND